MSGLTESVVVLTGAGVSAESGIPTFRGAGGLWRNHRAIDLATPQAFRRDPKLVWEFYDWRRGLGPTVEVEGEIVQKPWEDLSNQEKLDMVYGASKRLIQAQASTALFDTNLGTARDDTQDYIDEEFGDL